MKDTITYQYYCKCVMSDAAFHHHYDQLSASACFGFTHSVPIAGFIVLTVYLFMYSYYAHLLQYRQPFRSRTTTTKAKLITFLCNKCLSVTPIWFTDLLPVWPRLSSISPWYAHRWVRGCMLNSVWEMIVEKISLEFIVVLLVCLLSTPQAIATLLTA